MKRVGILRRLTTSVVAGLALMTGVAGAAPSPAQAYGTCSASQVASLFYPNGGYSIRLNRTPSCTYYGLLVITDSQYAWQNTISVRVERRENGSVTAWRQVNTEW